jgi:hypothetical protein
MALHMKFSKAILFASVAMFASTAHAQIGTTEYDGTYGSIDDTDTVTVGDPVITQTGDSTVDPYQNTISSAQEQEVTTTGTGFDFDSVEINGIDYFGFVETSGSGTQTQVVTETQVNQYDPNDVLAPPTVVSTSSTTANVGAPVVTAVSAEGFYGSAPRYSSTLTTSGAVTNNSVTATQNSSLLNSAGLTFEQRIGVATYNPSTGAVTVDLPTSATSSTTIGATGISTTGTVAANSVTATSISTQSLNMNGGRITNVGAGTATTDAVNLGQLNSAVSTLNTAINGANGRIDALSSLVAENERHADAGIAVATALSGGFFLPGKQFNLTANVAGYRGEAAVAAQLGALISENVAVNAGVATSFNSYGGTAIRGGFTFGF